MQAEETSTATGSALGPLVSIALCTYNGERFLVPQLDSILAQDYEHLEIIVVDDASSDGTWAILQEYAAREPRMRAIRNESNLGHLRNFERALAQCSGDYIAPADQDDIWLPGKISRLLSIAPLHAAVYCDSLLIDESGRSLGRRVSERLRRYSGRDPSVFVFFNCASGHAMLLQRETVKRALPFPDVEAHDWWLAFVAASLGGIAYLDEVLVHYRRHAEAITHLGRERTGPRTRDSRAEFNRRRRHLAALQTFASPHQAYFRALLEAWEARSTKRWSASLFWLLFQKRNTIFFVRDSKPLLRLRKMLSHSRGLQPGLASTSGST